jgi:hypothetical protein
MFYFLLSAAVIFFLAHVILLFTAFPKSKLAPQRYFYSHLTLWITGVIVFLLALFFSGSGQSSFIDYFDTTLKKTMILVFTASLSLVANAIVKLAIVPLLQKNS